MFLCVPIKTEHKNYVFNIIAANNSRSCSRCGSINSTKSAIVVTNSEHLANGNEFEYVHKSSTPSLRHKRCASNLSDEDEDEQEHQSEMGKKPKTFINYHLLKIENDRNLHFGFI